MLMNIRETIFHVTALWFFTLLLLFVPTQVMAKDSPCGGSLQYLNAQYDLARILHKNGIFNYMHLI